MNLLKSIFILFILTSAAQFHAQNVMDTTDYNKYFKPLKWRCIGPYRGGRSNSGTGVIGDPSTYYMGTTGGGLWKTTDMGLNWSNVSDGFFKTGSVGAVAVSESDPNIVYVGMGEHAVRGVMTHHGDGIYKSTDAGKTWKSMGLSLTQHIARIQIHPKNPDLVYVAVQGPLYSASQERGIYNSKDGGKTWNKLLYINDKTGCNELSMDMNNPLIIYASMWEHGRQPWKVTSGGPGSGLYKSTDGGESWEKMGGGLPKEMGKMAIAVSRSNSEKVYALIESDYTKEAGGLYVSENSGKSWSQVSSDHRLIQRSWYYIEVFPDPKNENVVYVLSASAFKSIDGGRTWDDFAGATHGDYHDLWINPHNPQNMIISDDGGCAITMNQGASWSHQLYPTAQMYRINVDNDFPYNIYGGQQDNSSVKIASREIGSGSIGVRSWSASAGGESAFLAFDPDDPKEVLGGSYLGTIEVLYPKSKGSTNIMAAPIQYLGKEAKAMKYRFNWNAPIVWSKHNKNTYYHGAQHVLQTKDLGKSWIELSPDLTRNEKDKQGYGGGPYSVEAVGAENYGTLAYILESPYEKGIIYTGSDDGLVYITKDNGAHWENITPAGLKECLVNAIEVSPHDKKTIYIATTRYKFNDHTPGLYKSSDYGKTWTSINEGIPYGSFTRVVREDEHRKDLLYAGTETGIFISFNGGKSWKPWQLNLPTTPITDLRVHKGNLIAATSGRSYWILDDLSLLHQYTNNQEVLKAFKPTPVHLVTGSSALNESNAEFKGMGGSAGVNPATGMVLYYYLHDPKDDQDITLTIKNSEGKIIRAISSKKDSTFKKYDGGPPTPVKLSKNKGLNRFVWDLRHHTMNGVPDVYIESSYRGHKAIPGKYSLTFTLGDLKQSVEGEILPNPLYPTDAKTYVAFDKHMTTVENELVQMHNMVNAMYAKSNQLQEVIKQVIPDAKGRAIIKEAESLIKKMKAWDEEMIQRKSKAYDDVENFENKFTANYLFAINHGESDVPIISEPTMDRIKELNKEWSSLKSRGEEILNKQIPAINKMMWEAGVGAVWSK